MAASKIVAAAAAEELARRPPPGSAEAEARELSRSPPPLTHLVLFFFFLKVIYCCVFSIDTLQLILEVAPLQFLLQRLPSGRRQFALGIGLRTVFQYIDPLSCCVARCLITSLHGYFVSLGYLFGGVVPIPTPTSK